MKLSVLTALENQYSTTEYIFPVKHKSIAVVYSVCLSLTYILYSPGCWYITIPACLASSPVLRKNKTHQNE